MLLPLILVQLLCQALRSNSLPLGTADPPTHPPCSTTCPDDWIQFIWDVFTLKDPDKLTVTADDVDRLFYAMDLDADFMVTLPEFEPFWRDCSLICDPDIEAIFNIFTSGDDVISRQEIFTVFSLNGDESFTRAQFDSRFNEILDELPNKGCPTTSNPPTSCPAFIAFG